MWVKICGNTRLEDCLLAAELGADAVGFVFAAGKRTMTAEQVAAITQHLPAAIEKIGVFTSTNVAEITHAARTAGLTGIQMHGGYDPALALAVRQGMSSFGFVRMLQVVTWNLDLTPERQLAAFAAEVQRITGEGVVDVLLVDSRTAQRSGGTGCAFDWQAAAPVLRRTGLPVIVAGGLHPGNVAEAIAVLKPWGVDVSSGVERAPGAKDAGHVRDFLRVANAVGR